MQDIIYNVIIMSNINTISNILQISKSISIFKDNVMLWTQKLQYQNLPLLIPNPTYTIYLKIAHYAVKAKLYFNLLAFNNHSEGKGLIAFINDFNKLKYLGKDIIHTFNTTKEQDVISHYILFVSYKGLELSTHYVKHNYTYNIVSEFVTTHQQNINIIVNLLFHTNVSFTDADDIPYSNYPLMNTNRNLHNDRIVHRINFWKSHFQKTFLMF